MNNPLIFKTVTAQKIEKWSWEPVGLLKLNCMQLFIIFTIKQA